MLKHKPVLLQSAVNSLNIKPGGCYVDATLGGGGYSRLILEKMEYLGTLICFDLDPKAIKSFQEYLNEVKPNHPGLEVFLVNRNFRYLDDVLEVAGVHKLDGVVADLGLSTDQIESVPGISYVGNSNLDMRLDSTLSVKAKDLLNGLYQNELQELFEKYGDVKFARELSKEIVRARKTKVFENSEDLKHLIQKIVPYTKKKGAMKNPEAKVFQALRIAVNDELNSLRIFLPLVLEALQPEGVIAIVSFHSGEDRVVKEFIKMNIGKVESGEIIKPTADEIILNKRSESAKLRIIKKI